MSKYVKNLITDDVRQRLSGVNDALLVNLVGMKANSAHRLRSELRKKNIHIMVVKNGLAARAVSDTPLAPMLEGLTGTAAVCWGAEDIVSLSKEIMKLLKDPQYAPFAARGAVLDGQALPAEKIEEISKWPSRPEQLSILVGQILSPGATLNGQLIAVGGALASQIEKKAEGAEGDAADAGSAEAAVAEAAPAEASASSEAPPAAEASS
ncbi:MAG: 50S ribosomal protein L10 [Planctomycetota bacterium]